MQSDSRCSYRSNVRCQIRLSCGWPRLPWTSWNGHCVRANPFLLLTFFGVFSNQRLVLALWRCRFGCRCVSWLWQASLVGTTLVNEAFGTTTPSQQQHHHHPYDHHHHYHHRRHHHRHRFYYCLLAVSFSQVRLQWLGRVDNSNDTVMSDNDRIAQAKHAMI